MAKRLIRTYVFTPGAAGVGNIQIPGRWDLSQFLLVTNTVRNQILYNFADSTTGATVTFTAGTNTNFPYITQDSDGYTTCLLYTSPSPRDGLLSRMPSSA